MGIVDCEAGEWFLGLNKQEFKSELNITVDTSYKLGDESDIGFKIQMDMMLDDITFCFCCIQVSRMAIDH